MSVVETSDIVVTAAAQEHLRRQLAASGGHWLRLSLRRAGCSGLEYVWQPVDAPSDGDLLLCEDSGLHLCVDAADYARALRGLRVDYQQDMLSSALVYSNPNQTGSCGCGVSFTVEES
ncbi:MAG: iron-sulfur cluster assembly accessory protein [Mariprofundales bacterium]